MVYNNWGVGQGLFSAENTERANPFLIKGSDILKRIRNIIAIIACKLLIIIGKLAGKKGSSAPGGFALKISPTVLKDLASQVKKQIIVVCGTNGKTTTNNLLYTLLKSKGYRVVGNIVGANMLPGIACSFIAHSSIWGNLNADYATIECDEASLRRIVPYITPDKVVITNLFRDQLDRFGEVDITISLLNEALDKLNDTELILNGDDPLSAHFGNGKKCVYFGIDEDCNTKLRETKEGRYCAHCGEELSYNYTHYSQLGDYYCQKCGFKRPTLSYAARSVDMSRGLKFTIYNEDKEYHYNLNYRGFYNIYNILASVAVLNECGEDISELEGVFANYKPQVARMEPFSIKGKTVILNLAKNPAGFNQAIATVLSDTRPKDVMIALNDGPGDGTDVSWIWDVDFEKLSEANMTSLTASGIRMNDLALRLKYAGFENINIKENNKQTLVDVTDGSGEIAYILVNYTAMFGTQTNLKALEGNE